MYVRENNISGVLAICMRRSAMITLQKTTQLYVFLVWNLGSTFFFSLLRFFPPTRVVFEMENWKNPRRAETRRRQHATRNANARNAKNAHTQSLCGNAIKQVRLFDMWRKHEIFVYQRRPTDKRKIYGDRTSLSSKSICCERRDASHDSNAFADKYTRSVQIVYSTYAMINVVRIWLSVNEWEFCSSMCECECVFAIRECNIYLCSYVMYVWQAQVPAVPVYIWTNRCGQQKLGCPPLRSFTFSTIRSFHWTPKIAHRVCVECVSEYICVL